MVTYEHVPGDLRLEAGLDNPAAQKAAGLSLRATATQLWCTVMSWPTTWGAVTLPLKLWSVD